MVEGGASSHGAVRGIGSQREDVGPQGREQGLGVGCLWIGVCGCETLSEVGMLRDFRHRFHMHSLCPDAQSCTPVVALALQRIEEQKVEPRLCGKRIAVVQHQESGEVRIRKRLGHASAEWKEVRECAD